MKEYTVSGVVMKTTTNMCFWKKPRTAAFPATAVAKGLCQSFRAPAWPYGLRRKEEHCPLTEPPWDVRLPYIRLTPGQRKCWQACPDGIMLSNGPGDPKENTAVIEEIKKLYASDVPIFAICLGHQLMAWPTAWILIS